MTVMTRRAALREMAAVGIAGLTRTWPASAHAAPLGLPIGLQLYTVNDELAKDFQGTLDAVAEIGYSHVELPSFYDRRSSDLRRALEAAGLRCVSAHVPESSRLPDARTLQTHAGELLDFCHELGVEYAVCSQPWRKSTAEDGRPRGIASFTLDDWQWLAEFLNGIGEQAKVRGLRFAYHNHNQEFRALGATTGYDELLRLTDPALVQMQLDCGYVATAGLDPAHYLRKSPGRFPMLHVKDVMRHEPRTHYGIDSVAVGQGVIDWREVFSAAIVGGVKHYYVEQEPPFKRPALDCIQDSYDYLRALAL